MYEDASATHHAPQSCTQLLRTTHRIHILNSLTYLHTSVRLSMRDPPSPSSPLSLSICVAPVAMPCHWSHSIPEKGRRKEEERRYKHILDILANIEEEGECTPTLCNLVGSACDTQRTAHSTHTQFAAYGLDSYRG